MPKQGFKVIDSDIHVVEPRDLWLRYLEPEFVKDGPRPAEPGKGFWQIGERSVPVRADLPGRQEDIAIRRQRTKERYKKLGRREGEDHSSPVDMIAAMDTEGLDIGVVFRTYTAHATGTDDIEPKLAAAICRAFNNWLRDFCNANPVRLLPTAQMALHDVDLAIVEARRAVKELGAVELVLPNHQVKGRPFYDRTYDPLWATAVDLNVPVAFHGINLAHHGHVGVRYFDNFPLAHASGHAIESMLALGAMLTGGVFERFPTLRAAFLEGLCSWAPSWLYCLDERWEKFGNEGRYGLKHRPSTYFRRQCFLSVDADEELVVDTIKALGDDNIVISTDWPHGDSSFPQALNTFLKIDGLSEVSRRKILWDNCARLYNLRD